MRSITISTGVFARIWSLRRPGEETEDQILRRLLPGGQDGEAEAQAASPPEDLLGVTDRRYGVHFPEGFEIFRNYLGTDYQARAMHGIWLLGSDGQSYASLNELSRAVGARTENAWTNWFFRGPTGRRPVSDLRDQSKVARRKDAAVGILTDAIAHAGEDAPQKERDMLDVEITWRDDVVEALGRLGGRARLHQIYAEVQRARREAGRSLPPSLEAVVRKTLEENSSDSDA
jgi:hypothetical protein